MKEIAPSEPHGIAGVIGGELQAQWVVTRQSLSVMAPLHEIWDRSNSDWALRNLTLPMGGPTIIRQMRQISAEIEHRSLAMNEAKFGLLRKQAEIDEWNRRLAEETLTPFERTMLELDVHEKTSQIEVVLRKFSGAMKDVAQLKRCFDELVEKNGGVPTAEDAETEAHYSSLVRALLQALRDMRQGGTILWGNQEFLEQCGVNPSTAFEELRPFIDAEHKHRFAGTKELMEFVSVLAEGLIRRGATPSLIIPLTRAATR